MTTKETEESLNCKAQKVRLTYLPHLMTEPFYRYKFRIISWQEFQFPKITFDELELGKLDIKELRELLDEE